MRSAQNNSGIRTSRRAPRKQGPPEWHEWEAQAVLRHLGVDPCRGLSAAEAAHGFAQFGPNEITATDAKSPWLILRNQVSGLMAVILIAAAAASAILADYKDSAVILAIVFLNVALGFSQEYKAERAVSALKKLARPIAKVRRDEQIQQVPAVQLVPGDIILLEAGDVLGADCRVVESANLHAQESALTGESHPVRKVSGPCRAANVPLGDRRNMVYLGTFITAGRGLAVVTATGMSTELGRIAGMLRSVTREQTPLQRRLSHLARRLAIAALAIVAVIFVLGLLRGENAKVVFLTAVSLAVAAIPEGLPAVVTIALALGSQRMLRRKALIRSLAAVETLGSVTVICADKTGTLTENRMAVRIIQLPDRSIEFARIAHGGPMARHTEFQRPGTAPLLVATTLCNDAIARFESDEAAAVTTGDPTEVALLLAASRFGLTKASLEPAMPRVAEVPFSSERKRMTTIHALTGLSRLPEEVRAELQGLDTPWVAFTKGSVESLLNVCDSVLAGGKVHALDESWRQRLLGSNDELSFQGMRVLGAAIRHLQSIPPEKREASVEQRLTFIGMIGIMDPPRAEVASAVATCRAAGVRLIMITGDHPLTARHIAHEVGMDGGESVVSGAQLEGLSETQLRELAKTARIYARVSPEHKLKIIAALQENGHVVAMTGDGVNDAPALKKADIGVAMGLVGTDVAREAADLVLLDDNLATIVSAVGEGRVIYDNIRKFVKYISTTNSGEIWVMFLAPFLGLPLPLLPLQILWMNLVTDGLPALALTVEPSEPDTMRIPPRSPGESIFAHGVGRHITWVGLLMGILSLGAGYWYWHARDASWQTVVFTALTLSQMAHVMAIRSERPALWADFMTNKSLLAAVLVTSALQVALIYCGALQDIFGTAALSLPSLMLSFLPAVVIFCAVELEKRCRKLRV